MVGKQGFIRTMEAVIAIVLVLGFLLYVLPKQPVLAETAIPDGLASVRNFILNEFSTNQSIRDCVDSAVVIDEIDNRNKCNEGSYGTKLECKGAINSLLEKHVIPGFDYACEICPRVKPCIQVLTDKNKGKSIYPGSVFIYLSEGKAKYVRIYFWRE